MPDNRSDWTDALTQRCHVGEPFWGFVSGGSADPCELSRWLRFFEQHGHSHAVLAARNSPDVAHRSLRSLLSVVPLHAVNNRCMVVSARSADRWIAVSVCVKLRPA